MGVIVYVLNLEYNKHESDCVSCIYSIIDMNVKRYTLIIKYKEYGHDAFMLKLLLELVFGFEYDFVRG